MGLIFSLCSARSISAVGSAKPRVNGLPGRSGDGLEYEFAFFISVNNDAAKQLNVLW
ncbi:hypothetical protein ARMGADRAFT_1019373 [Armillaria gallica]|uniref:Uncharacterized protein n=1 Tax=Armillaria gallica TaxID=47427 RepID=A0A2H3D1R2_ARMGA|nr:hypothetical protein ARMGADRAFT_1019373 [Armillaria gallica]